MFSLQEVLDAYVLIQIGPMEAFSVSNRTPVMTFFGCAVQKPRVPGERDRDRAPVAQSDCQGVITDDNLLCSDISR